MRAVVLEEKGGPEVLQIREVPDPSRRAPRRCWSTSSPPRSTGPTCSSGWACIPARR